MGSYARPVIGDCDLGPHPHPPLSLKERVFLCVLCPAKGKEKPAKRQPRPLLEGEVISLSASNLRTGRKTGETSVLSLSRFAGEGIIQTNSNYSLLPATVKDGAVSLNALVSHRCTTRPRCSSFSTSSTVITSAYFASMSNKLALCGASARSPTADSGTMHRKPS